MPAVPVPIKVELDHAQARIDLDRLTVLTQGSWEGARGGRVSGWDSRYYSNTWVDAVTFTGMLRPSCLTDTWNTTYTGVYARLRKSAWTLATSSKWDEVGIVGDPDDDTWLCGYDVAGETGVSTSTWAINRGWLVSWFTFTASDRLKILSVGWNSTASAAAGVSVDLWSNGDVDVYKDGIYLQSGSISGSSATIQQVSPGGNQKASQFTRVLLIPFRKRELLIISPDAGAGFTVVFGDLAEGAVGTITGNTNFWFKSWAASATLQMAPLQYPSSGYLCGALSYFAEPPETGATPDTASIWKDDMGSGTHSVSASLVEASDASTAFTPDSVKITAFLRFDFTGDGVSTNFVYAGAAGYARTVTTTDDSEKIDATAQIAAMSLQVSERASDVRLNVTWHNLTAIEALPVAKIRETCDRPLQLSLNWTELVGGVETPMQIVMLDGRGENPETRETIDPESYDVAITYRDWWKALEDYRFQDPVPLDGVTLKGALEWIAECAGLSSGDLDVYDASYVIPNAGGQSAGEWNCEIETGDTAADWWDRLHEAYAPDWFYGVVPTSIGLQLVSQPPSEMEQTASCTIYDEVADAVTARLAAGDSAAEAQCRAHLLTYRNYRDRVIPAECNEVRVTGRDPRTGKPIQAYKRDAAAMDASTAPSLRPANWKGQISRFGWVDPIITTQDLAEDCVTALYPKLTQPRLMAEIECQMLFRTDGAPLWRGQVVELNGHGLWRVCSFEVDFELEASETEIWSSRPAHYVLQKILAEDEAWRGRFSAFDLLCYDMLARLAGSSNPTVIKRGGEGLVRRAPGVVAVVT